MNWNKWLRQMHRWVSITFTAIAAAIFVALGLGMQPAAWVYYLPLIPLALLTLSGLYMFLAPYMTRLRAARRMTA